MKFKLKIPRLILSFLAGAAWTILFWLAVTLFRAEISIAALGVLCVLTVFALKDKSPPQLGLNITLWFVGIIVSTVIENLTDFAHVFLPEWNNGTGFGAILLLSLFIGAGALTITAAAITSGIGSRKK